jgi:hypothetical protein
MWLPAKTYKNGNVLSQQNFNKQTIRYAQDTSLHFDLNTGFSNYDAAGMLAKARRRPGLVQRLRLA